ncbi:MAG: GldG family protein, partial [Oscillospiraceae bacterium]|nr:GldG family protein [Oscillospiraceae bacterium]
MINKNVKKYRTYSALFIAIVLAIVVVVNMIFSSLNLRVDLTQNKLYTLSDITINLLKGLNSKIKVTVLADESTVPLDYTEILNKYKANSNNIEVVYKDPQKNPLYFNAYTGETNFSQLSIIVEKVGSNPLNYRIIQSSDLEVAQGSVTQSNVEKSVTEAITYVTSDKMRTIYVTTGHQEMVLNSTITKDIQNRNYSVTSINLNNEDISFDTTDMIMMFSPKIDLSQTEANKLKDYLSKGGRCVFAIDYIRDDFPNLKSLINAYGLDLKKSIIIEADTSKASPSTPYNFIPTIKSHGITQNIGQGSIYLSSSMPILELDTRKSTLELTPLLTSSALSYDKTEDSQSIDKAAGDASGPFTVAELVIDKASNTGASKDTEVLVVSTSSFVDSTFLQYAGSQLDLELLFGAINFMTDN